MKPPLARIDRVAAILTERAGDLIVATPALRNLRASLPEARITLICPPGIADVLRGWDGLDDIIAFDGDAGPEERLRFVSSMRERRFALAVALTSNWPAYQLTRVLGARTRAGVVYGANLVHSVLARAFLTHPVRVWIFEPPARDRRIPHRAEELLKLNAALGLDATPRPFELPLSPADQEKGRARLAHLGIDRPIVLHLAARWLQEGWTPRDVVGLAEAVRARGCGRLVLTAGPSDAECAAPFRGNERFILVDDLDFRGWASVLGHASLVITHDTSAVHVASALCRPVVAVYERKRYLVQSQHWAPWFVRHRVLRKTDPPATTRDVVDAAESLLHEVAST
jgi:heptosyltransferase-2